MDYTRLGTTGLKVSGYCIGADNFGDQTDEAEAIRIMSSAFDAGVNFIDTANSYVAGKSEEIVGRFVKTRRSEVVPGNSAIQARAATCSRAPATMMARLCPVTWPSQTENICANEASRGGTEASSPICGAVALRKIA